MPIGIDSARSDRSQDARPLVVPCGSRKARAVKEQRAKVMPKGIDSARCDRSHVALPPLIRQADSLFLTCFRGGAVGGGVRGISIIDCSLGFDNRRMSEHE